LSTVASPQQHRAAIAVKMSTENDKLRGWIMTKMLLGAVAISALLSNPALSADMPLKAAPRMAAPVYNWTGCYIKGGGGYGMWNQDTTAFEDNIQVGAEIRTGGRGWFGAVGAGCDYQIGERWVIGVFGDYDFSSIKGDFAASFDGRVVGGREKLSSAWAVGGRIGYLITPTILTYISGGFTEARFSGFDLQNFDNPPVTSTFRIDRHTYSGWFLGSGFEYNLGFFPGLFWRTEYRFASYDNDNLAIVRTGGTRTDFSVDSEKFVQTIRSELVWRFNWGGGGRY
jgi:outer membrane immunogenic protein